MQPGCEADQRRHNVGSFLAAVQSLVPAADLFTQTELEADGIYDRPRVTQCLLHLKRLADGSTAASMPATPLPPPGSPGLQQQLARSGMGAERTPPRDGSPHASDALSQPQFGRSPPAPAAGPSGSHAAAVVTSSAYGGVGGGRGYGAGSITMANARGLQAAQGVTELMKQCNALLHQRMYAPPSSSSQLARAGSGRFGGVAPPSPDTAVEHISPVIEGVLNHLTTEYEKRLLSKDHDLAREKEHAASLQKQVSCPCLPWRWQPSPGPPRVMGPRRRPCTCMQALTPSRPCILTHALRPCSQIYNLQGELDRAHRSLDAARTEASQAAAEAAKHDVRRLQEQLAAAQVRAWRASAEVHGALITG
jgi:hypothetical protein